MSHHLPVYAIHENYYYNVKETTTKNIHYYYYCYYHRFFYSGKNITQVLNVGKHEFEGIKQLSDINTLSLNFDQTNFMMLCNEERNVSTPIIIDGAEICGCHG